MIRVSPHLTFNGECEAAFQFYAQTFGGTIVRMLPFSKSPMARDVPSEWHEKIFHASLMVGNVRLIGADVLPANYRQPQGFFVFLNFDTPVDARRIFEALADRGTVQMPIQATFWSPASGAVIDRFGVPWEIAADSPKPAPADAGNHASEVTTA
jgi:PhnB protein